MTSYRDRLAELVAQRGRLCVGVDPHARLIEAWGHRNDINGLERVARDLVAAIGDQVAVFKPQSGFFEAFGSAGVSVLARVLDDIRQAGALSILDVKRGDIGSTMGGYAHAYLSGETDLTADAITLTPYLGFGSLEPAFNLAHAYGRGVYVLCRTSNPEGEQVQLASRSGSSIAQQVVDAARELNAITGQHAIGLVIGATLETLEVDLTGYEGSILVPGIGAQGARMETLTGLFGATTPHLLPSVSRQVMQAGPEVAGLRAVVSALTGDSNVD